MTTKTLILISLITMVVFSAFGQNYPKSYIEQSTTKVPIELLGVRKDVSLNFIVDGDRVFFLPVLFVSEIKMKTYDNNYIQLFSNGKITNSTANTLNISDSKIKLHIRNSLADSEMENLLKNSFKSKFPEHAQKIIQTLRPLKELTFFVDVNDGEENDFSTFERQISIGTLNNANIEVIYNLGSFFEKRSSFFETLTPSYLNFGISGFHTATFGNKDIEVSGNFIQSSIYTALNQISSTTGTEKVIFIPIGGTGTEKQELSKKISSVLNLNITEYQKPPGYSESLVDKTTVENIISKSLESAFSQINLSTQSNDTRLVFLLSNNISMQTTIGEVKTANYDIDTENVIKEMRESGSNKTKKGAFGFSYAAISGNGSADFSKNKTKKSETMRSDIKKIKESYTGDLPVITGMTLNQVKQLTDENKFNTDITILNNAEDRAKDFTAYFPLNDCEGCKGTEELMRKLSTDLYRASMQWGKLSVYSTSTFEENTLKNIFKDELMSESIRTKFQDRPFLAQMHQNSYILQLYNEGKLELINIDNAGTIDIYKYEIVFNNNIYEKSLSNGQDALYPNPSNIYGPPIKKQVRLTFYISIDSNSKVKTFGFKSEPL